MNENPMGANAPLGEVPLGQFGAPGFTLSERLDMSGHRSGRIDPHLNTDVLRLDGSPVIRDLTNTQIPGMNGMQNP